MKELVLRKSAAAVAKTALRRLVGSLVAYGVRSYRFYEALHNPDFDYSGDRIPSTKLPTLNRYVAESGVVYRENQTAHRSKGEMEETSQYYLYKYIEAHSKKKDLTVCNIGAFYCGADVHFLQKSPEATVYGLDFGDLETLNQDIATDRLKLFSGYPLETLESFVKQGKGRMFDYAIFARTAALMNPNELFSYMKALSQLADRVCFLEVAKTTSLMASSLDVAKIPLEEPVRIFNLMRIHNYPAVLEKFGFEVEDAAVLPPSTFKQFFVPDHQFLFAAGRNKN